MNAQLQFQFDINHLKGLFLWNLKVERELHLACICQQPMFTVSIPDPVTIPDPVPVPCYYTVFSTVWDNIWNIGTVRDNILVWYGTSYTEQHRMVRQTILITFKIMKGIKISYHIGDFKKIKIYLVSGFSFWWSSGL